ncbi:D-arabinose 5-phosphate isomerase [Campylobacter blaseri]|uniref:KpsF/GutQ family sugar-phosphate isomerase n=1 Tax=Campylobacter blaseri TaxID=2042961 RepID=A0A2P8R3E1_9BACT|nr:KpsF/GutQ family sugar-phosphate isomerase [Campylobacter blaseri]PSM53011.1 KpsF/GutQ family sugar-phosphate isomerase [Campylobacter blaseri]PSM54478.1 KpsF/GutQ family sugar-phosphate isomerase [Campylobacter blaseri]QKF85277.1 D-arabinose 5-phosphate isomerase [Campylobacter blaseri]
MSEILNVAKEVLKIEGEEILRQIDLLDDRFENALNILFNSTGRVVVTGVGKSGHIGAKMAATFASTGTPSFFMHPTEALHGDLGMVKKEDIILAISFSGESDELIKIMPHLKRYGVKIISMTSSSESSLAKFSDEVILLNIIKEACHIGAAPTTSTTLTLALGDALAVCLMKMKNFKVEDFANFHPGGSLGRRLYLKAKDVMRTSDLPILNDDTTLKNAIDVMTHGKLGTVLLTNKKGELVAILSDGDLRRALMNDGFDIEDSAIKYATKNPKTINNIEILASKALEIIESYKIQLIAVVDKKNIPIGTLHIHDLTNLGL